MKVYTLMVIEAHHVRYFLQSSVVYGLRQGLHGADEETKDVCLSMLVNAETLPIGKHLLGTAGGCQVVLYLADIDPPETDPTKVVIGGYGKAELPRIDGEQLMEILNRGQ